jgi:hypothetical protein
MTTTQAEAKEQMVMGPVSYVIVEYPGKHEVTGEAFRVLVDLVDRGIIRILDLRFVTRHPDGSTEAIELADIDGDGKFDITIFEGVSSGLIGDSDIADATTVLEPGSSAAILIFENRWAKNFTDALRQGQARLVAAGYIPHDTLAASLDATEG